MLHEKMGRISGLRRREKMREGKSKIRRQEMRAERRRRQRRQRLLVILGIFLAALVFIGLLVAPTLRDRFGPVGEFNRITPMPRPQEDGRTMGNPDAPVTIEVFSDFQCVACANFGLIIEPQIAETMVEEGQVHLIYRHYPFLDDAVPTSESEQAANASMCAAEQNMFWAYHDIVFVNFQGVNQGFYRDSRLVAFAESIGLDMEAFNACFNENRYRQEIQNDRALAEQLGVTGTPSIFINGEQIAPGFVPSFQQIQQAVEAELGQTQ
jgi:protein-disulfide isomerase